MTRLPSRRTGCSSGGWSAAVPTYKGTRLNGSLAFATLAAGFAYAISPGPAFLAMFALAAARGRPAAARFAAGHLGGDVLWCGLALASMIGVDRIGPALFGALGLACGLYLTWLGLRAVTERGSTGAGAVGAARPLATGVTFGLTNPKAYPVATAIVTAIALPFAGKVGWADAPALLGVALTGILLAYGVVLGLAGLPGVRRFFVAHGTVVRRVVGVAFIAFGVRSIVDAGRGLAGRG